MSLCRRQFSQFIRKTSLTFLFFRPHQTCTKLFIDEQSLQSAGWYIRNILSKNVNKRYLHERHYADLNVLSPFERHSERSLFSGHISRGNAYWESEVTGLHYAPSNPISLAGIIVIISCRKECLLQRKDCKVPTLSCPRAKLRRRNHFSAPIDKTTAAEFASSSSSNPLRAEWNCTKKGQTEKADQNEYPHIIALGGSVNGTLFFPLPQLTYIQGQQSRKGTGI